LVGCGFVDDEVVIYDVQVVVGVVVLYVVGVVCVGGCVFDL